MFQRIAILFVFMAASTFVGGRDVLCAEPAAPAQQPPQPTTDSTAPDANCKLLEQRIAERDRLQREIDNLRRATGTPQQILVQIRAIEVNRSKLRRLGVDWATANGKRKSVSSVAELLQPNASSSLETMEFGIVPPGDAFHGFLQAMEKYNIAKVLAEPSVVTVSGRPASILVGGEIPLPAEPQSEKAVELMKFGTQVDMLATCLGNDKVRMELRVRVSEPDFSRTITIEGKSTPTLNVRQIDTAFELPLGQSAVYTGFVQRREVVVKRIAGHEQRDTEEIETLFVATPEIVTTLNNVAPPEVARAYDAPSPVK